MEVTCATLPRQVVVHVTCMKEAVYSYQETKKGKSPAQIRAAIERGEWMKIDLELAAM